MTMAPITLRDFTSGQLARLCEAVGFRSAQTPVKLLHDLLGTAGERTISEPSQWPSDIADDTTPVEFSVNFGRDGTSAVRILGETVAGQEPSNPANVAAARRLMTSLAQRYNISLDRFHAVEDLFLPPEPQGKFGLWYSFIFKSDQPPRFKIYLNPDARGPGLATDLVSTGMRRLGFGAAYEGALRTFRRNGEDHFAFFSLDLDNTPTSRVKLYVAHQAATASDVARAATVVADVDPQHVQDFCTAAGGHPGPFTGRPLLSSYTYVDDAPQDPRTYTLYVPIRDYVGDDDEARDRVQTLMEQQDLDPTALSSLIAAVSNRPLDEGVGLIAHVSLRLGAVEPGMTVYLSSEAYGGTHGAYSMAASQ
jgi:DMATS type aromatic prenyltransferase